MSTTSATTNTATADTIRGGLRRRIVTGPRGGRVVLWQAASASPEADWEECEKP